MIRRSIVPLPVVAAAALALLLSGCTAAESPAPKAPAEDLTHWTMPLDEFQSASTDALHDYATMLLGAECLAKNGVEYDVPWQPTDDESYLPAPTNFSSFPILTLDIAREQGYRAPRSTGSLGTFNEQLEAREPFLLLRQTTPGFDTLWDSCLDDANAQLPGEKGEVDYENTTGAWVNQSWETTQRDPSVREADSRWRECMIAVGYRALPDGPLRGDDEWMPTQALRAELGIPDRYQPGDGGAENPLTQEEIDLAVDDATCRESSGWTEAMYEAMWNAQEAIVQKNADELVRQRDAWTAERAELLEIIAAHAPEQG